MGGTLGFINSQGSSTVDPNSPQTMDKLIYSRKQFYPLVTYNVARQKAIYINRSKLPQRFDKIGDACSALLDLAEHILTLFFRQQTTTTASPQKYHQDHVYKQKDPQQRYHYDFRQEEESSQDHHETAPQENAALAHAIGPNRLLVDISLRCLSSVLALVDKGLHALSRQSLATLIVRKVMVGSPVLATNIAELVLTSAGHVVASLIFFNNHPTFPAFLVIKVLLQEVQFILLAISRMFFHQAVTTDNAFAGIAHHGCILRSFPADHTLTALQWAHLGVRVFMGQVKLADFIVPLLNFDGKALKEMRPCFDGNVARWIWTGNFLKLFDSVDSVLMEALFTVMVLVLAFRNIEIYRFVSNQADLTFKNFF